MYFLAAKKGRCGYIVQCINISLLEGNSSSWWSSQPSEKYAGQTRSVFENDHLVLYPASILKVEQEIITPTPPVHNARLRCSLESNYSVDVLPKFSKTEFSRNKTSTIILYNYDHPEPVPPKSSQYKSLFQAASRRCS